MSGVHATALDAAHRPHCPRCAGDVLDDRAYSYLLGLYLGDGRSSHTPRHPHVEQ